MFDYSIYKKGINLKEWGKQAQFILALSVCSRIADKSIQSILQLNPEQKSTAKKGLAISISPA